MRLVEFSQTAAILVATSCECGHREVAHIPESGVVPWMSNGTYN